MEEDNYRYIRNLTEIKVELTKVLEHAKEINISKKEIDKIVSDFFLDN